MTPPWMPLYVADYLADTGHLSTVEHGAYLLLIMHYWQSGGLPTNDKQLARIVRLSAREWASIRETVSEFFDAEWHHRRIDEEMAKAEEKISKRSAAGKAGAAARHSKRSGKRTTNASQPQSQPPPQSDTQEETKGGGAEAPQTTVISNDGYAFEGRIIRLTDDDFRRWEQSYPRVKDMRAELTAADDYIAENPSDDGKWYFRVSNWLKRANGEAVEGLDDEDIYRGVI